jgi:hypothetical protein
VAEECRTYGARNLFCDGTQSFDAPLALGREAAATAFFRGLKARFASCPNVAVEAATS